MTQRVLLELPDTIYQPAQRIAEATRRPLAEVLVGALQAALPALEGLPPALANELAALEKLIDDDLWQVMLSRTPPDRQRKLNRLLRKNKTGRLAEAERAEMAALQAEADRLMLRKARAAVLLRFRGQRLPTLAELRKLAQSK